MKSVLVITACVPGGLPTQGSIVARRLSDAGIRVRVLSKAGSRVGRLLDVLLRAFWEAARHDVVLVDVFGERAFVYESFAILCGAVWKRRVVVMLHNGMLPDFVARWPRWTKFVLSKPDLVCSPHAFLQQRLAPAAIRIDTIIPNFVDLRAYTFRRRSRVTPRFLFLRGMDPIYNPEMALRAFGLIQQTIGEASLTMAGPEGPSSASSRALVNELGLRNVRFLGMVPKRDIPALADEHDIHLHTNRLDNMPVSIIEMWACGLAIVGTRVGGIPYLVRDGEDAVLVPSEDHEAMAGACLRLLAAPEVAEGLSVKGRARAEGLTWERVEPVWLRALFGDMNKSIELGATSLGRQA